MKLRLLTKAQKHLAFWRQHDPKGYKRVKILLQAIAEDPCKGLGHPEPLKHELAGWWSRRITKEHRLVYKIEDNAIVVLSCRYHYE